MQMALFKALGVVVLLLDLPLLAISLAKMSFTLELPSRNEFRSLVVIGFAWLVGIGLLGLRKWAALYFSVTLFGFGLWLFVTSIEPGRFPWNLFYMAEGISLMLPLIVTIRVWSQLSSGGKWFF